MPGNTVKKAVLFVISGPSGVGKGTLIKQVLKRVPSLYLSVSATTRKPRTSEINGRDYIFLDDSAFLQHIDQGDLLEWAEVHGKYYGTLRQTVEASLADGKNVILEIDVKGAIQIREQVMVSCLIFTMPPSLEILRERLTNRHTETKESLEHRMRIASYEMGMADIYDHVIMNDDLDRATAELADLMVREIDKAQRLTRATLHRRTSASKVDPENF